MNKQPLRGSRHLKLPLWIRCPLNHAHCFKASPLFLTLLTCGAVQSMRTECWFGFWEVQKEWNLDQERNRKLAQSLCFIFCGRAVEIKVRNSKSLAWLEYWYKFMIHVHSQLYVPNQLTRNLVILKPGMWS